jgi:phosphoglycerol transferase
VEQFLLWSSKKLKKHPVATKFLATTTPLALPIMTLALSLWLSIASYWNILPGIFQDEYVYSMGSRKLPASAQPYPNYLFSFIFESTNLCGEYFYQCAKGLNTFFLLALLFVFFFVAKRLFSFSQSMFLSSVVALSPMTIFASFFMPEMLFFFLNTLALLLLLRVAERPGLVRYSLLSLVLGLALLTKRHELFLLPGFAIALFLLIAPSGALLLRRLVKSVAVAILIPVALRQAFVFFATGDLLAPILGSTYSQSFRESTSGGSGPSSATGVLELMSQGFWHLVMHLAVLLIAGLGVAQLKTLDDVEQKIGFAYRHILVATLALAGSIVPVVVFFESYLTLIGDDHSLRLLMRYYEFLLLPIMLLASFQVGNQSALSLRKSMLMLLITSYLVFVLVVGPFTDTGPADSPFMHGLKLLGPLLLLFLVGVIWSNSKAKPSLGTLKKAVATFTIPALLLASGIAVRIDVERNIGTTKTYYDHAGIIHKQMFPKISGKRILILGSSRTEVSATKFWIDKPNIPHVLQGASPRPIRKQRLEGIKYVVALYPTRLISNQSSELVFAGQGFAIFELK